MNKLLLPTTAIILLSLTGFVIPAEEEMPRASIVETLTIPVAPVTASSAATVSFDREAVTSIKKKEEPKKAPPKAEPKQEPKEEPKPEPAAVETIDAVLTAGNAILPGETADQKLTGPKEAELQTLGRTAADREQGTKITGIAKKYLGSTYVWGGTSPTAGWDCSGYVQYVFREAGIELPRIEQWVGQQKIKRSEALPGDFIVQDGGTHVGIYAGNGMMYSALNPNQGTMLHSVDIMPAEFYRISQ